MSQVVGQGDGLAEVFVEPQSPRDAGSHLCDFEGMGQPGAVIVALVVDEHLRLVLEAPEGAGVKHAVAILLERRAVSALGLLVDSSFGIGGEAGVGRQRGAFGVLELFPCDEHYGWYGSTA